MTSITRRRCGTLLAGAAFALVLPRLAFSQAASPAVNRVVFAVTDNDPARWGMILNNMKNIREGVGGEPVEIELVAYGPGILMFKSDSVVKDRVKEAIASGVKVGVCRNTMAGMKFTPADMMPEAGYVPAGVIEVMRKQQQGWIYIRS